MDFMQPENKNNTCCTIEL